MKNKKKVNKAEEVQAVGKGVALTDEQMAEVNGGVIVLPPDSVSADIEPARH